MNIALVLAAGKGIRMNVSTPKQFLIVDKKPLFIHTIDRFMESNLIDKVLLVINKDDEYTVKNFLKKYKFEKELLITYGGETRQKSVFNGLRYLENKVNSKDIILIHDAARANVSSDIIKRNIEYVCEFDSAITGIEINDTVVQKNEKDFNYIDREKLISIQTPQSFYFEDIFEAYEKCALEGYNSATDDSSIMKFVGKEVSFVKGSKYNIKVTTEEDLKLMELFLQNKIR